jgi:hypothetical protein
MTQPAAAVAPGAVYTSPRYRYFTSFAVDIDLVALGGEPCRAILVGSNGVLVTTPLDPISGDETGTVTSGTLLPISATVIKASGAGTTITSCWVFW